VCEGTTERGEGERRRLRQGIWFIYFKYLHEIDQKKPLAIAFVGWGES
jgi:hypothetical protein